MPVSACEATKPAALERGVFSTAGLPAARRTERWESHNAAALIGLDVRAAGPLDAFSRAVLESKVSLPTVPSRGRFARSRGSSREREVRPEAIET